MVKGSLSGKIYIRSIRLLMMLLFMGSLLSCSQETVEVVSQNYVILINNSQVQEKEIRIYIYQVIEEFERVAGPEVWELEDFSGGRSAIEVAKESVLENIIRSKIMLAKAEEFTIKLTDYDNEKIEEQTDTYYNRIDKDYLTTYAINREDVRQVVEEYYRGRLVYENVMKDFVPDEETVMEMMLENEDYARLYQQEPKELLTEMKVQRIFFPYNEIETDSDEEKEELLSQMLYKAEKIRTQALEGKAFEDLVSDYDESDESVIAFSKAFIPEVYKEAISNLQVGEISSVIEGDLGIHIFKILEIKEPTKEQIETFNNNLKEFEERLYQEAVEELRMNAFENLYEEWKKDGDTYINNEAWSLISINE